MRWLLAFFLISNLAWADKSVVIPVFLEAAEVYVSGANGYYLRPEVKAVVKLLESKKIDPSLLTPYNKLSVSSDIELKKDKFDNWIADSSQKVNFGATMVPEVTLHAFKFDVIEDSDDFTDDNIYVYYFITDGVVPTGKVTSIYKGLDEGESFFFNEIDRAIFPLAGISAKRPDRHLIVDFGIVESDDDDIKLYQQLSSIIIDIAAAVYSAENPQSSVLINNLRQEVKALTNLLLNMNNDDRLVTDSIGLTNKDISNMLQSSSYTEFSRKYKKNTTFDSWKYKLHFRLIKK